MQQKQERPRVGEELSGTVVVLLDEQVPPGTDDTLLAHARRHGLDDLVQLLLAVKNPPTERQVTSVSVGELLEAERARLESPFPPLRSLTRYWRVDVAEQGIRVEEAVARLRDVRGVALAYGELVVTDPAVTPGDDPLFPTPHSSHTLLPRHQSRSRRSPLVTDLRPERVDETEERRRLMSHFVDQR